MKSKRKPGSKDIWFVVYIRTKHLVSSGSVFFQKLINMSKHCHMTTVLKELDVFRKYFRARQDVIDYIQASNIYGVQNSI